MNNALFHKLDSAQELERLKAQNPILAVWFTGPDCRICKDLKPRLGALFSDHFPRIRLAEVDCAELPAAAASHQVFSVPVLMVFFEGRESLRMGRGLSLADLGQRLQRSYDLFFR